MRKVFVLVAMLTMCLGAARAQAGVYAGFAASDYHVPNVGWQYGPVFGVYYQPWAAPFIRAGLDVRGSLLGSGNEKVDSILVGPRVQIHPHVVPLMPYGEILIGGGHVNLGQGSAAVNKTAAEYQVVGGIDMTVFPRLDWRVAEVSWGSVQNVGTSVKPMTVTTGLVLRLP
ncbi:MAG: hypothetical protein WA399_08105 [Acidobacteriaceae bacterium]